MFGCCANKVSTQYVSSGIILMPDYTPLVTTGRWCCIDTLIQRPRPQKYLSTIKVTEVKIKGYDCYGGKKKIKFLMKPL